MSLNRLWTTLSLVLTSLVMPGLQAEAQAKSTAGLHRKITRKINRSIRVLESAQELIRKYPELKAIQFRADMVHTIGSSGLRYGVGQLTQVSSPELLKAHYFGMVREMSLFLTESSLLRNFIFEDEIIKPRHRRAIYRKLERSERIIERARTILTHQIENDPFPDLASNPKIEQWFQKMPGIMQQRTDFLARAQDAIASCTWLKQQYQISDVFEKASAISSDLNTFLMQSGHLSAATAGQIAYSTVRSEAVFRLLIDWGNANSGDCPSFLTVFDFASPSLDSFPLSF